MRSEFFSGPNLRSVFRDARAAMGDDVVLLRTDVVQHDGGPIFTLLAAPASDVEAVRQRLNAPLPASVRGPRGRGDIGPFVVALVGPSGVGKTTTAAKLALSGNAFRNYKVGTLALGAQRTFARRFVADPLARAAAAFETASEPDDVPRALARLDACDFVIVDTPGDGARGSELNATVHAMLQVASPDETHLMIPATVSPAMVPELCAEYAPCRPTHALLAKVDELNDDALLGDIAVAADLPVRWLTAGQDLRADLALARNRILSALSAGRVMAASGIVA